MASYGSPFPVSVVPRADGGFFVVSTPYPLHSGEVQQRGRGVFVALGHTFTGHYTATVSVVALRWLTRRIVAEYRRDLSARFSGPQRLAMALGTCPAHRPCRDLGACPIDNPHHRHVCKQSPADPRTVFCNDHARLP